MTTIAKTLLQDREESNLLDQLDREDLVKLVKKMLNNGVALTFHGKRSALEISRRVRPRVMRREPKLHVGAPDEQSRNLVIEGENLQTMVTLYKYRGGSRPDRDRPAIQHRSAVSLQR
jgi:adenine-specific DNA-methyltransferase